MNERTSVYAGDLIDFDLAVKICERTLSRTVPLPENVSRRLETDAAATTAVAYERVSQLTGLSSKDGPPRAVVYDRRGWAEANIASLRDLLSRIEQPSGARVISPNMITRASSGTQLGLMFSWLSRRVLGQYDMVTGDPSRDDIYYVGPNIYGLERRNGFAPSEFRLWIALHEVTHHLQFSGVPWMREYFFDLVSRATALGATNAQGFAEARTRAMEVLRRGENPLAEGGIAALIAGSKLYETMREAQALMSLLEGHAEYVMSVCAPEAIPGADRFIRVLRERRGEASPLSRALQQALGFEAKLRQYHEGHLFIDEIVRKGGEQLLARLWESRQNIPDIDEIHDPSSWIARVEGDTSRTDDRHALS